MKNDDMRMGLVTGCGVVGGGIGWGNLWEDGVMVWGGGGGGGGAQPECASLVSGWGMHAPARSHASKLNRREIEMIAK